MTSIPSSSTIAMFDNGDILAELFDSLETGPRSLHRKTLASCALVCRGWSDPASKVLWRRLDSFHPLWALLAGRHFPPSAKRLTEFWEIVEPEVFVKETYSKEPVLWKQFLHRASHVREIGTASCGPSELALIRAVVQYNGGATFLPALQRIVWRHGYPSDTSLLGILSPSVRNLELATTRFATPLGQHLLSPPDFTQFEPLFVGLASAAPFLLRLTVSGRQLPAPTIISHLLSLTRMRELYLYNELCILAPNDLHTILESMPNLKLLYARLRDFSFPDCSANSLSLRELRLQASSEDIAGLLSSCLRAPNLSSITLGITDSTHTPHHSACLQALASAPLASSLHELYISTVVQAEIGEPPAGSYAALVEPLAPLAELEVVELRVLNTTVAIADADMRTLARAWPRLRRLVLAYVPSEALPPLAALRHFARHCPALRELSLTKMAVTNPLAMPSEGDSEMPAHDAPPHPLQELDLRLTFAGRGPYDMMGVARFLDRIFPNLDLREEASSDNGFAAFHATWARIEKEIRLLRGRRGRVVRAIAHN
ncbi:hypothetical protein BD413DRAFT_474355 [Trametes elegans]|nr:hypothetical protein BD413DRAFT_474355 [Trametes elegans]